MAKPLGWKRLQELALEAMVVVASILVAFALDAWWDERGDEARERAILVGVLEDLRSNQEQRESRIALGRRSLAGTAYLLNSLAESGSRDRLISFPDTVTAAVLIFPTYDPLTSSLDGLIASEGFSGLSDIEIQRLLARWRQGYDDLQEDQELMLGLLTSLAEGLSSRNPMPPEFWNFTPWVRDGTSTGHMLTVPSESPSLSASLGLKISFLTNMQSSLEQLGHIEEELIARIEEMLVTG